MSLDVILGIHYFLGIWSHGTSRQAYSRLEDVHKLHSRKTLLTARALYNQHSTSYSLAM